MYYEEEVINGVLCRRGLPDAQWIPFTAEQLTQRVLSLENELIKVKLEINGND